MQECTAVTSTMTRAVSKLGRALIPRGYRQLHHASLTWSLRSGVSSTRASRHCTTQWVTVGTISSTTGQWQSLRTMASIAGTRLVYAEHGNPVDVLHVESMDVNEDVSDGDVLVEMLAAPINPADINQVQGVYPKLPDALPAVGGNEGVGKVTAMGAGVTEVAVGDLVIPAVSSWGTWQSHRTAPAQDVLRVPHDMDMLAASMIAVNPCTAYRMLVDFVKLDKGDCVIQNGGNSGVGRAVSQLARAMGVHVISIVRNRPDLDALVSDLESHGATKVVTDEDMSTLRTADVLDGLPRPKLALNCVGGRSSLSLCKSLAPGGAHVTYGGMSKRPVTIPTGKLIFDDIVVRGFWMTRWNEMASREQRQEMLEEIAGFVRRNQLTMQCRTWPLANALDAIKAATDEYTNSKEVLLLNEQP
eukprot:m.7497 g.7497  ORF g.7497 m.7497 type:complete len:416 (-) comp2451_c0_seq2:4489-5736(-)